MDAIVSIDIVSRCRSGVGTRGYCRLGGLDSKFRIQGGSEREGKGREGKGREGKGGEG